MHSEDGGTQRLGLKGLNAATFLRLTSTPGWTALFCTSQSQTIRQKITVQDQFKFTSLYFQIASLNFAKGQISFLDKYIVLDVWLQDGDLIDAVLK
uniref:Uncharacterized protein n=1 Tax=Arundo donax TaxID=35708 RepID=A0A0A9HQQ5_ARUDO